MCCFGTHSLDDGDVRVLQERDGLQERLATISTLATEQEAESVARQQMLTENIAKLTAERDSFLAEVQQLRAAASSRVPVGTGAGGEEAARLRTVSDRHLKRCL